MHRLIHKKVIISSNYLLVKGIIQDVVPIPSGKRPYNYVVLVDRMKDFRTVHKKYVCSLETHNEYKEKLLELVNGL